MSAGINSIHLVGRLGQDPEVRQTASGTAVCNMTIATKDYKGNTSWHRAVAWGKSAEFAGAHLNKGDLVYLEGRMEYREWEKDGQKRTSAEISCNTLQALGSADRGATGHTGAPKDYPDGNVKDDFDDSSIPF